MPPELVLERPATAPPAWRDALVRQGAVAAALIVLFIQDWSAMAGLWWTGSAYNHILVVPAMIKPQSVKLTSGSFWMRAVRPGML